MIPPPDLDHLLARCRAVLDYRPDAPDAGAPFWREDFDRLSDLRGVLAASGDHEAVLLIDAVRIHANTRDEDRRRRWRKIISLLTDDMQGRGPC